MDQDQMTEELQNILNQIRLDLLLRGLGTTVLRRKFQEIYAKLNNGQEWTDGTDSGDKFCRSKWGHGAFVKANLKQQEMMKEGDIQNWDLNCLQSVITQMLTAALKDMKDNNSSFMTNNISQMSSVNWDPSWWAQMSKIRQLANIRHSIAHMPNETLSQGEFDEKWSEAVIAIKALGAKSKEIKKILQTTQSALNLPSRSQHGQKGASEKVNASSTEETKTIQELRAKIEELQLENQRHINDQKLKDEDEGQVKNDNQRVDPFNKKADSLTRKGNSAGSSGDWDQALEFYTRALEIPDISDDLRKKIYMNRAWIHLRILQMPENRPFNFNLSESGESKESATKTEIKTNIKQARESKFVDQKFLEMEHPKLPEKLTEELKEFHLTSGIADAESALQLAPDQNSMKAYYCLAQCHQLKGDWNSALTFFDLALGQSDLNEQLQFDRNVCQLEVLNQTEVEEINWIPGKKYQTVAGLTVNWDSMQWSQAMKNNKQHKLSAQIANAHFLVQGLCRGGEDWIKGTGMKSAEHLLDKVVKWYEGAAMGGLPWGVYNLGLLLQEGNGVQRDFFGAVRLFKMAANFPVDDKTPVWMKEGIVDAQYRLGLCYEFGLGVGKDDKKALHWFEMASLGNYGRATRKLGDIYSQGLLGVSKDEDMAIFCWQQASAHGDFMALPSAAVHVIQQTPVTWEMIFHSLHNFSCAVFMATLVGSPNMLAIVLDRKRHFEFALATVLQELTQSNSIKSEPEENEREPEGASWNVPAFDDHTLRTIHLLELAQTPEFRQKLEATPNWKKQFPFTDKLVEASEDCVRGLAALRELNKLYREALIKDNRGKKDSNNIVSTEYPPDLQKLSRIDRTILIREDQLVDLILTSFSNSIRLVGAAHVRDQAAMQLIRGLAKKFVKGGAPSRKRTTSTKYDYALFLLYYFGGDKIEKNLEEAKWHRQTNFVEPLFDISKAAVQGNNGKFEEAADEIKDALKHLMIRPDLRTIPNIGKFKSDLLFVQALCCKSAALTRGVNSANRKKIKEAMDIFQEFLSVCPKDEPRRAEAHYQLGLCTLYLEKMKVKGQVKSAAKDILNKVELHFTQGEAVEQEFPWREFQLPHKSPIKLILQQKLQGLEGLVKKTPAKNLTLEGEVEKAESSCLGKILDPSFKFPTSSFPLKLRENTHVGVITKFRKWFKATHKEVSMGSPTFQYLNELVTFPESPFVGTNVIMQVLFVGCFEIVEPILFFRVPNEKHPDELEHFVAFTVVQDESGAIFNLKVLALKQFHDHKVNSRRMFKMGSRIILNGPKIRIGVDGETSLDVADVEGQIFHLPSTSKEQGQKEGSGELSTTRKCGFCGKIGGNLRCCSKCQAVYYCDKECQKADWDELKHHWICPFLKYQPHMTPASVSTAPEV